MNVVLSEKRKRAYKRRLLMNIPDDIDREITKRARHKGITKTRYVLQAVAEQIIKDKLYE